MYQNFKDYQVIDDVIQALSDENSYKQVYYRNYHDVPMPSISVMEDIMELLRSILFPGFFGNQEMNPEALKYYTGANIEQLIHLLNEQIKRGFCFHCDNNSCFLDCEKKSQLYTMDFIRKLPDLRTTLSKDVLAAFEGDPSTENIGEIIYCFPAMKALTYHRIAHSLLKLGIPLLPRIISEIAHERTGIDIHPGAQIGESFFIDHGTGTVIGETAIIGNNVRIYQNVTLGAKSFLKDAEGNIVKGVPRHPIIEDNVIIYAGASILGRITIGHHAIIGANVWVTENVSPYARIIKTQHEEVFFTQGSGI